MVQRIGSGSLSQEAILAAIRSQTQKASAIRAKADQIAGGPAAEAQGRAIDVDFAAKLAEGVKSVDGQIESAGQLPEKLLTGEVQDFHEVAVQLRQADISFRFAMEIRNKLIDAYREVMRMSV